MPTTGGEGVGINNWMDSPTMSDGECIKTDKNRLMQVNVEISCYSGRADVTCKRHWPIPGRCPTFSWCEHYGCCWGWCRSRAECDLSSTVEPRRCNTVGQHHQAEHSSLVSPFSSNVLIDLHSTPVGMWGIEICVSVCLSVCSHISKTHIHISPNFLYTLPVAVTHSSSTDNAIYYVFPVLWMTSCFRMMDRTENQRRRVCHVQFARWRHRGRRLPSLMTASCLVIVQNFRQKSNCSQTVPFSVDVTGFILKSRPRAAQLYEIDEASKKRKKRKEKDTKR